MPSFSIEVPGEANPLTESLLVHSLTAAASSNQTQIQTGTKQLQQWERSPGYYKHLQSAYLDHRLPVEIRYLAIIQLKNGIDKYWRKTATNAVSKDDKSTIRSRLLESAFNECDNRLAVQNALVIAKVARFEYPSDWPDVLTSLTNTIRSANSSLQLARALLVLLHIVKELSTGRLQRNRQNLQAATPDIVRVLGQQYSSAVETWRVGVLVDAEPLMQQSLLALKVLRRLLISGYEHPHRNNDVIAVWKLTQFHIWRFLELKLPPTHPQIALVWKHMVQLAKFHHEMARDHPAAFALLPESMDLVRWYWSLIKGVGEVDGSREDEQQANLEKVALKGLLILRACLKILHNPSQSFKHRTLEEKNERSQALQILLTRDFIREVMESLVTRFFVFRAEELEDWAKEPEEWEKREVGDGEDWEFSIRSCSEKLFLDLVINYKDILVQPLLQVFYSVANLQHELALFKDSIYTAIGLAAPVLHEHLDFDAFIRDVLVYEVQNQSPDYKIIRRRAAILLGQWITVRISRDSRPTVYQIFQHLLDKDEALNDQVVRVTAGRQLKDICDSWEFDAQQFMPYAETTLTRLMQVIEEVELTETKMALLNTVSIVVERLDNNILPFAERIVTMLPPLWEASGEEHLMKQAILTILARLVNAMKADSLPIHSMVFPIIRGAVEPGSETEVYLLEDALDLWAAILAQTPEPASAELLALIPYLFPIYELGSENLRKALEITESYVLLAPAHMLSDGVRMQMFSALSSLLGSLRPDANGMVCNLAEVIIRTAEKLGGPRAVTQTATDLFHVGFLGKILEGLKGTTGPHKKDPLVIGIVETDYFSVLARLILGSLLGACQAFQNAAPSTNPGAATLDFTMQSLLDEWFSHFENVGDPSRRKLMCLALTKLLETDQPFILINLQSLMTIWTDVITELREDEEDATGDSLVYSIGEASAQPLEAPEDTRRRELSHSDAVHTVNLPAFVTKYLDRAVAACGGQESFKAEWLVNVDQDVVDSFVKLRLV